MKEMFGLREGITILQERGASMGICQTALLTGKPIFTPV
jgi:hypothetical protein